MKAKFKLIAIALLLPAFNLPPSIAHAQGSLAPPSAPAPMMKTLDQIEPRTPLDSIHTPGNANNLFVIAQGGSYYLTTNLIGVAGKSGISIQSSNVTVDLCGFSVVGVSNSVNGFNIAGNRVAIAIRNGVVRDWGGQGITGVNTTYSELSKLRVVNNVLNGIRLGGHNRIENCLMQFNGNSGIQAGDNCSLSECEADSNALSGFATGPNCSLRGCMANGNSSTGISTGDGCVLAQTAASSNLGDGIVTGAGCSLLGGTTISNAATTLIVGSGSTIKDFTVEAGGSVGILTFDGCTLIHCTVNGNASYGIEAGKNCTIAGCTAAGNQSNGIFTSDDCTIKDCTSSGNTSGTGFSTGNGCTVTGCTATGNLGNGFYLESECSILNCTASANNYNGIEVLYSCLVKDNTLASNSRYVVTGSSGIYAAFDGSRIEDNVSNSDQYGISVNGARNFITRNTVRAAGSTNYVIAAGNIVGTIIAAPASGAIAGFTGGSGVGTSDPWANFSY